MFDKHTGFLTGYTDIGVVNSLFTKLEEEKKSGSPWPSASLCL